MTVLEEVTQKFWNSCSKKFKKIPWKTFVVVYFALILVLKSTPPETVGFEIIWESRRDGFLFYRYSCSKMLEYLFWKFWKNSKEKIHGGVLFKIFANKALHDGWLQLLLEEFCSTEAVA